MRDSFRIKLLLLQPSGNVHLLSDLIIVCYYCVYTVVCSMCVDRIVSVSSGWDHCLALDDKGRVMSWGSGQNGKNNETLMLYILHNINNNDNMYLCM